MNKRADIGRLALRVEGDNWNAYYAPTDTMNGAVLIGSIAMGAVVKNLERKQQFILLMQCVVSDFIAAETSATPTWGDPELAPERERAGRA